MRLGNQITAGAFMLLGLYMAWEAPRYHLFTQEAGAGPGMLPLLTGIAIAVTAAVAFVISTRNEPRELDPGTIPERDGALRLGGTILALAGVVAFLPTLGYRITMFLFLASTMRLLSKAHPLFIAVLALGGSVLVYWVFNDKLLVILPRGPFGF